MIPSKISNPNTVLGAPVDWDHEAYGECVDLPVRIKETTAGVGLVSAWMPTDEERAAIATGAPVLLTVLGGGHPPVALDVGSPADIEAAP